MGRIILSTESGADLPKDLVERYQIQVVPMHVIMEGKDYLDGELSVEEVFDYHHRTKKSLLQLQQMNKSTVIYLLEYEKNTQIVSLFILAIRQEHPLHFKVL